MFGFGSKREEKSPPPRVAAPSPAPVSPPVPAPPPLVEIPAKEARERIAAGAVLLDVREAFELQMASVKGALHIPMGQIPARIGELDRAQEIVCMCHHGMRSANVAGYLLQNGFTRVLNLSGGIAAWAAEVDPSVPQY